MNAVCGELTVLLLWISCTYANTDYKGKDTNIFESNFGCDTPGKYLPHRPNTSNCPCGTYAVNVKTKHLGKYEKRTGYWDEEKRRWQLYRCKKCDICHGVPVMRRCSADTNTKCGTCQPPLMQTSIGCLSPDAFLNETTNHTARAASLHGQTKSVTDQPMHTRHSSCTTENKNEHCEWIAIIAVVVLLLCVIMVLVIFSCVCIHQCRSKQINRRLNRIARL